MTIALMIGGDGARWLSKLVSRVTKKYVSRELLGSNPTEVSVTETNISVTDIFSNVEITESPHELRKVDIFILSLSYHGLLPRSEYMEFGCS